MVAFGYSCDRCSVAQRLVQPCGQIAVCRPVHTSLARCPGEGTPENAAFRTGGLCADLPFVIEERRGFCSKCIKA